MGDGKIALILDVMGLAQRANVVNEAHDHETMEVFAEAAAAGNEKRTFLLFTGPDNAHMAVPLDTLARLEEFPASQVERSGTRWVTQYRGEILPLVKLAYVLEERRKRLRHPEFAQDTATADARIQVWFAITRGNGWDWLWNGSSTSSTTRRKCAIRRAAPAFCVQPWCKER